MRTLAAKVSTISRSRVGQATDTSARFFDASVFGLRYKQLMDPRLRGTLRKTYLTLFWMLVLLGIGGSGFATWAAYNDIPGGFCKEGTAYEYVGTEEQLAELQAAFRQGREECRTTFGLSLFGSWFPLLVLVFTKKLLYEKWFLWLISDWKSSPDVRPVED